MEMLICMKVMILAKDMIINEDNGFDEDDINESDDCEEQSWKYWDVETGIEGCKRNRSAMRSLLLRADTRRRWIGG